MPPRKSRSRSTRRCVVGMRGNHPGIAIGKPNSTVISETNGIKLQLSALAKTMPEPARPANPPRTASRQPPIDERPSHFPHLRGIAGPESPCAILRSMMLPQWGHAAISCALTPALCRAEEGAQRRGAGVGHQRAVRAHAFPYLRPHNTGALNDLELMNPTANPTAIANHHHGGAASRKAMIPTRTPAAAPRSASFQLNLSALSQATGGASCGGISGVRDMRSNVMWTSYKKPN